jgi:hypothetical protein
MERPDIHRNTVPIAIRASRLALCLLAAASIAFAAPAQARPRLADLLNGWDVVPAGTNPDAFEMDFAGDVTAVIPPQTAEDQGVNPFYALFLYNASPYNQITVAYDSSANLTRVVMSGGALPNPAPAGFPGPHYVVNGVETYHTGLNQGWNSNANPVLVSRHWIYSGNIAELPALEATWHGIGHLRRGDLWAAIYVETGDRGSGSWHLADYQTPPAKDGSVKFEIANHSDVPITLGVIGYQLGLQGPSDRQCHKTPACEANQKALDTLNDQSFPIPGEEGSQFTTAKVPKKPLQPGESFVFRAK